MLWEVGGAAVVVSPHKHTPPTGGVCLCGETLFYEQLQYYAVYFI